MRPKIIIIEGTDGTGKSTLAKEIEQSGSHYYYHASAPVTETWEEEYIPTAHRYGDFELVLDRWHLGEWVWPQVFGRKSLFKNFQDFMACHDSLVALGAVTFIMTRDPGDVIDELTSRGETQQQISDAMMGYDEFLSLAAMGLPNVVMCDLRTARTMLGLEVASGDSIRSIH